MSEYGYSVEVPEGYDEAVLRARLALRGEGFSILSEMHVGGMLGPQTGSERQYLIMGVYDAARSIADAFVERLDEITERCLDAIWETIPSYERSGEPLREDVREAVRQN